MTNPKPSNTARVPYGLTRSQVARHLGIGITVHRMRLRGDLRPTRDDDGIWRYDPADVVRAAGLRGSTLVHTARGPHVRTAGETTALAFQIFDRGGGLREVVMALQITPEEVHQLYRDFKTSLDAPAPPPAPPPLKVSPFRRCP